jgi:uncharacterized membrane protein
MDSSGIPTDGPETVLGQAARRLGLRYSRTFVARAVASHRQPSSLLALVDVAKTLGIETTAGQTDAAEFERVSGPAIVHFAGPGGGGFGVLEAVRPDGFEVWDSLRGKHLMARDDFLASWSGIVALLERGSARGVDESNYMKNRLTEVVFSGYEPPALVGNRSATRLRILFGALVAVLLALAVAGVPSSDRIAAAAIALLSATGLGVAILTGVSIGAQDSSLSDRICARGKFVDCHSVLASRYSRVFGISLSDIGIAFFGGIVMLLATTAVASSPGAWGAVTLLYIATIPWALALIGVQVAMKQLCTLCLAVHTVNVSAAVVSWSALRPARWDLVDAGAALLLWGLFFCLLLFLAIPYFRKHQGLRILAGKQRRISGSPFASLAEVLTEPPVETSPSDAAVAVPGASVEHELAIFVHPSCGKCDPVLQQVRALGQSGLVRTFVGLAPKDEDEADRRGCAAVVAAGIAEGGQRMFDAYAAAKANLGAVMRGEPVPTLAAALGVAEEQLAAAMDDAVRRARLAEEIVDRHAEGTPALFLDGRLFRGELTHLAFLLEEHPDLLAPLSAGRVAGADARQAAPS